MDTDNNNLPQEEMDPDLQKMLEDIDDASNVDITASITRVSKPEEIKIEHQELAQDDMGKMISGFNIYRQDIEQGFKDDRLKIQEYLDMIIADIAKRGELKQSHLEALSSLMATKAMTTANKIRMLDSIAKMVSAIKNYDATKQNSVDMGDIRDLLSGNDELDP